MRKLMKKLLLLLPLTLLIPLVLFLYRQIPTALQLNQGNTVTGTSSQTSDVSPSTSDVDFAVIQNSQKSSLNPLQSDKGGQTSEGTGWMKSFLKEKPEYKNMPVVK